MVGNYKPFNEKVFISNDPKSREVVIDYMKSLGFFFESNTNNKYTIDLLGINVSWNIELERRSVWNKETFPFSEINIPARKQSTLENDKTCYCIVNSSFDRLGILHHSKLTKYINMAYLNNNKSCLGEYFFKIPRSEFVWIKI